MRIFSAIKTLIIISLTFVLQSCKKQDTLTSSGVKILNPSGDENYLNIGSEYIFDQSKLHTFEINLPEGALNYLDKDPTLEEYVEASLTFNGETISPVKIRYKGSIGAWIDGVSGEDWGNPSGEKTATKLSLKINFNWNENSTKFYGLNKLQLHSQNNDPSQMRERLGYWLYRQMGVPAPRAVHARVIINGKFYGVYALIEQIDDAFAAHNFVDGSGNVYKEVWPLNDQGEALEACDFLRNLKTNTSGIPSAKLMSNFAEEIEASETDENLMLKIEQYMDIDKVLAYAVVDYTIRNDDGAFHWYCEKEGCGNHNFYWVEEPSSGKIHLIPWDLDHAFDNIIKEMNPVTPIADGWGEKTNNCSAFPYGDWDIYQKSAVCDKLIGGWTLYSEKFNELKTNFLNGPLSFGQADSKIEEWANQIRNATKEAARNHNDAVSIKEWESAMEILKAQLAYARMQ